jgi:hypothetical protein
VHSETLAEGSQLDVQTPWLQTIRAKQSLPPGVQLSPKAFSPLCMQIRSFGFVDCWAHLRPVAQVRFSRATPHA